MGSALCTENDGERFVAIGHFAVNGGNALVTAAATHVALVLLAINKISSVNFVRHLARKR